MKKSLLFGCALALLTTGANAADFQQYVALRGGYSLGDVGVKIENVGVEDLLNIDEDVYGLSVAYGLKKKDFRAELELNWNEEAKMKDGDYTAKWKDRSLSLNAYYDIPTNTKITPYVGAGVGVAFLRFKDFEEKHKSTEFTWQVGAGVSYALNDKWNLDVGYRYIKNGDFSMTDVEDYKYDIETARQQFYLGARFAF